MPNGSRDRLAGSHIGYRERGGPISLGHQGSASGQVLARIKAVDLGRSKACAGLPDGRITAIQPACLEDVKKARMLPKRVEVRVGLHVQVIRVACGNVILE